MLAIGKRLPLPRRPRLLMRQLSQGERRRRSQPAPERLHPLVLPLGLIVGAMLGMLSALALS